MTPNWLLQAVLQTAKQQPTHYVTGHYGTAMSSGRPCIGEPTARRIAAWYKKDGAKRITIHTYATNRTTFYRRRANDPQP